MPLPHPLRHHYPVLGQHTTGLVAQRRALLHSRLAHPMHRLHILLLDRLHPHQAHVGALRRFADGTRVVVVVFVPAHVRLHVLRRNQPHLVAQLPQLTRPVMRTRTPLHPHHTPRHVRKVRSDLPAPEDLALENLSVAVAAHDVKCVLCQVQTDRRNLAHGLLLLARRWLIGPPSWRIRRRGSEGEETISSTYNPASVKWSCPRLSPSLSGPRSWGSVRPSGLKTRNGREALTSPARVRRPKTEPVRKAEEIDDGRGRGTAEGELRANG